MEEWNCPEQMPNGIASDHFPFKFDPNRPLWTEFDSKMIGGDTTRHISGGFDGWCKKIINGHLIDGNAFNFKRFAKASH
jgi:hypothetical protein